MGEEVRRGRGRIQRIKGEGGENKGLQRGERMAGSRWAGGGRGGFRDGPGTVEGGEGGEGRGKVSWRVSDYSGDESEMNKEQIPRWEEKRWRALRKGMVSWG